MPPRKAARKGPGRYIEEEVEGTTNASSSSSEEEQGETTLQPEEDEEDDADDDDDDENDDTVGKAGKKQRKRTEAGIDKAEMRKWRRLAIEEKEAIVNEGGLVWRDAQPLLASLSTRHKREAGIAVRSILDSVEERLNKVLVPRTTSMPHASRNLAGGSASVSSGSIVGSVMSWQVERGGKLIQDEEEEDEKQDEVSVLELGGFSSDIALLETLLLPEATETVAMSRAVEEQERELESSKAHLIELKADREGRERVEDQIGSKLQARLRRARELFDQTGAPMLNRAENMALRDAATIS